VPEQGVSETDMFTPVDNRLAMHAGVLVLGHVIDQFGEPATAGSCAFIGPLFAIGKQVTSVAYVPGQDVLLALTREPAELLLIDVTNAGEHGIPLGGASVGDTGHELFTRNAGSGMACASCHAEGGDDGHTWQFEGLGARRTQSLQVGLAGTAPFHWQGDEASFTDLVADVMVGRMGGVNLSPGRIAALEQFVYALPAPAPKRASDDPVAQRGQALFEGQAECNKCHTGSSFSDGKAYDIGKGVALQVPSLVGIAYRTPLMHDGCAADLHERFDPSCGGATHGNTASLNDAQLDDLIAYLETL
jgi:cytochrome c553